MSEYELKKIAGARLLKAISKDGIDAKIATFGPLNAGDCHQWNGTLTFLSDGTGQWDCETTTRHTHSGDIWHALFVIEDALDVQLFVTPTMSSPKMNDDGTHYTWVRLFNYDAHLFDRIAFATERASC